MMAADMRKGNEIGMNMLQVFGKYSDRMKALQFDPEYL